MIDYFQFGIGWAVTTGIIEAALKPVAKQVARRALDRIAPAFYAIVDEECRVLAARGGSGAQLRARVRERLSLLTGEDWSDASLQPLWRGADLGAFLDRYAGQPILTDSETGEQP